jgi:hypothetical protein
MKNKLLFGIAAVVILAVGMMMNCDCGDETYNYYEVWQEEEEEILALLSELDQGPAYRFDSLEVDDVCDERNDLCALANLLDYLGFQAYLDNQDLNFILVSLGPTVPGDVSDVILAQVRGIRDWANDAEWGGLNQFYVDPKSVDPETSLVKVTMTGENYYEEVITALTDGPVSLGFEVVPGQELNPIPPLHDVKLYAETDKWGEELTNGEIEAVAELDDLADTVAVICNLFNITVTRDGVQVPVDREIAKYFIIVDASELGSAGPLMGLPTVDRDGDGIPDSYRIRLFFDAGQIDLVPSYYPEWEVVLSIGQPTISADDVEEAEPIPLTAAVIAHGYSFPPGGSRVVEFETIYSPDPGALPLGSPTVAAMTYEKNGIAVAWIVAGGMPTEAGPVIFQAEVPVDIDKAMIEVLPGAAVSGVTGLCAWNERASLVWPTDREVCEEIELTVLLAKADQFANPIPTLPVSGEPITFTSSTTTVTVNPTVTTDADGLARAIVDASGLTTGQKVIVTASWDGEDVDFTLTKTGVTHVVCFLGEPAFRVDKLEIPQELVRMDVNPTCTVDRSCNSLGGLAASMTNPELQAALDEGEANITFIYKGLTVDNVVGPTTVIGSAINGLCEVPYARADCEGGELEFFIDPSYYDPVTKELNLAFPTVVDDKSYTEVDVGTLSLPFPTDLGPVNLILCNLIVSGTVNTDLSGITGGLLTGAIVEGFEDPDNPESLSDLVESGMGMDWELAKAVIGEPDTECTVDGVDRDAYSVRLESTAIAVDLYEVPPWD